MTPSSRVKRDERFLLEEDHSRMRNRFFTMTRRTLCSKQKKIVLKEIVVVAAFLIALSSPNFVANKVVNGEIIQQEESEEVEVVYLSEQELLKESSSSSTGATTTIGLLAENWKLRFETRFGLSWQALLITIAAIAVPWCLVVSALVSRWRASAGKAEAKGLEHSLSRTETNPQQGTTMTQEDDKGQEDDKDATGPEEEEEEQEEDENAAPLHLHAMRIPARLKGSSTNLTGGNSGRIRTLSDFSRPSGRSLSRSSSRGSVTRSRSASPAPPNSSTSASGDGVIESYSSCSSVEGDIPPDILTDRKGFEELEPPPPHEIAMGCLASPGVKLPAVSERMSEETLDDCHAFSDLQLTPARKLTGSSVGSLRDNVSSENSVLETLDEDEEESLEDEEDDADTSQQQKKELDPAKKQQLGQEVLFDLLTTVSDHAERQELERARAEALENK